MFCNEKNTEANLQDATMQIAIIIAGGPGEEGTKKGEKQTPPKPPENKHPATENKRKFADAHTHTQRKTQTQTRKKQSVEQRCRTTLSVLHQFRPVAIFCAIKRKMLNRKRKKKEIEKGTC
jgi:hypothetical protein